jgi:hypothetical protein
MQEMILTSPPHALIGTPTRLLARTLANRHADLAGATAGFNIDIKHTLQALRPGHCHMALGRGLIWCPFWCFGLFTFTPSCRCNPCPILTVGGENTMEAG